MSRGAAMVKMILNKENCTGNYIIYKLNGILNLII